MHVEYPMLFRLTNDAMRRHTHVGVLEFSAPEGRLYAPHWVMDGLLLAEGGFVTLRNTTLPKGSFVKFRPRSKDFLDISDPKAVCVSDAAALARSSRTGHSLPAGWRTCCARTRV
jgi:ubiquitin fusion degradation protein 1